MKKNLFFIYSLLVLFSCTKRMDAVLTPAPGTNTLEPTSNSSVTLLNLYYLVGDVAVNGRRLTLFSASSSTPIGPTAWFPSGNLSYGQPFVIPDSLFDAQGNATVGLYTTVPIRNYQFDSVETDTVLRMHNNSDSPKLVLRYPQFLVPAKAHGASPTYSTKAVVAPMAAQGPVQPDHFKVRIINLSGEPTPTPYDALTLTYADGTPVASATTGIGSQQASDYAELPYGSMQLKVMDASGRPVEEFPGPYLDDNGYPVGLNGLSYSNLRTFMPGGVYTFLVSWHFFPYGTDASGSWDWPGVVVIKENSTVTSPDYIRMQAANALPGGGQVHFTVDGQDLGAFLALGEHSDYGTFSIGEHKVVLTDAGNKQLASMVFNTYSLDNLTLWAYASGDTVKILTTSNDFSNTTEPLPISIGFVPNPPVSLGFGWQCRFLNLSGDVPYATFLDQTGSFLNGFYRNVPAGYIAVTDPYVQYGLFTATNYMGPVYGPQNAALISAYEPASATDTAAGISLNVSLDHGMIANPALYSGGTLPAAEPGVYTIALVGNKGSSDPANRLRLMIIKHNK